MIDCRFKATEEAKAGRFRHVCELCLVDHWSKHDDPQRIHRNCGTASSARIPTEQSIPGAARRFRNFTLASIRHVFAGLPTCTQEQIDERHSICMACELYRPDKDNPEVGVCSHSSCGCGVSRQDKFVSKLAWSDQPCPLGKWPAIER